jgi:hypothetical protein
MPAMMLSLRAVLLAVMAACLWHANAQAQMSDRDALLPSAAGAVPATTVRAVPVTTRYGELTLEAARDGEVVLDSSGATRREIISRLFAGREVEIEWRNKAFAEEKVQGRGLRGTPIDLARRLLSRQSYVMSYDNSSDERTLARIVILGSDPPSVAPSADAPARARQESPVTEAARRRAAIDATRRAITAAQQRR